jgi:hypothetical protein
VRIEPVYRRSQPTTVAIGLQPRVMLHREAMLANQYHHQTQVDVLIQWQKKKKKKKKKKKINTPNLTRKLQLEEENWIFDQRDQYHRH